jgi:DNA-binding PadR family transcriptional regulator
MTLAILTFCRGRMSTGASRFHAEDLRRYLSYYCINFAPGSPDRVLRNLRAKGLVSYELIDRRNSYYELKGVAQ